jgi:glycosyltransferase involved in cell wall biosynthesis
MRILVLSNLYPPHYIGGYELGCYDVVEALKRRGHTLRIVTSTYGVDTMRREGDVYRCLQSDLEWRGDYTVRYWLDRANDEWRNRAIFKRIVGQWRPDLVYVWNMRAISLALLPLAQTLGLPICYYVSDGWLAQSDVIDRWSRPSPNPFKGALRSALEMVLTCAGLGVGGSELDLCSVQCTSEHLKQATLRAGKPVERAEVIHWGVDTRRFRYRERATQQPIRLLYVGQLVPTKGAHIAVEALRILYQQYGVRNVNLTIVGGTNIPSYAEQLNAAIAAADLAPMVTLTGPLPREQLPQIYQEHDLLVFPSIWDEPFSITLLEAMSSGLAVVGTDTGGSAEILRDDDNALIFPKGDAQACARRIAELLREPARIERIRAQGRATIERHFQIGQTIDRIERSLIATVKSAPSL